MLRQDPDALRRRVREQRAVPLRQEPDRCGRVAGWERRAREVEQKTAVLVAKGPKPERVERRPELAGLQPGPRADVVHGRRPEGGEVAAEEMGQRVSRKGRPISESSECRGEGRAAEEAVRAGRELVDELGSEEQRRPERPQFIRLHMLACAGANRLVEDLPVDRALCRELEELSHDAVDVEVREPPSDPLEADAPERRRECPVVRPRDDV